MCSSDLLNPICNKLLAALQPLMNGAAAPGQAIQVKKDDTQSNTPLPHNEHDQIVIAEIKKADLVINLLNDDPGLAMIGLPEKTYIQRQVELGREYARNQLIWIKPDIDIESEDIEPAHSQFLQGLESNENSSVIRLSSSELSREVTEKITEIQQAQSRIATVHSAIAAALLNYHGNDEEAAGRLKRFLNSKGVLGVSGPEFDDPRLTMKFLEAQLDQVNRLICVYSEKVGRDWVSFRLGELLKMADQHQHEPQACGIYFVPPLNKAQHGNFRLQTRVPLYEFDSNDIDHLEEHPDDLAWLIGNIG